MPNAGDERFEAFSGHSANDGVTPSRPTTCCSYCSNPSRSRFLSAS